MIRWLRSHPLAAVVPLQALLYGHQISLLAPWFDEADTLIVLQGSLADNIANAVSGLHPPLYFLLLYYWQRIPLGLSWTVQARALSVLFGLAATVAADHFWARRLAPAARLWFLALWALSPCLLLYCRMARSYSLQLLLGTVAAGLIFDLYAKADRRRFWALCGVMAALLYVHYVPALALLAAANLMLARARRWRMALAADAVVGLAFAPWLPRLLWSLQVWGAHSPAYALSGASISEIGVKLAYWGMSFTLGESLPDGLLLAGAALAAAVPLLLLAAARKHGDVLWILAPAAAVGFIGVMRWVSYPFIPARMLFTLPLFLGLVVAGARGKAGTAVLACLLFISGCGVWCYFQETGFRNKQYPLPMNEIAGRIRAGSTAADSAILVDSANSDPIGLRYALGPDWPVLETKDAATPRALAALAADARIRTVWFLRNTHDVSPAGLNARFAQELGTSMRLQIHPYEPFTPLETRFIRRLGMADPPAYFTELLEFRR